MPIKHISQRSKAMTLQPKAYLNYPLLSCDARSKKLEFCFDYYLKIVKIRGTYFIRTKRWRNVGPWRSIATSVA